MAELPRVTPSPPGYNFSSADLRNYQESLQNVAKQMLQRAALQGQNVDTSALLSAILLGMKRANSRYTPLPFGLDDFQIQQIDGGNPLRNFMCIQNVGSGDLMVVFEPNSPTVVDFSADASSQNVLNLLQLQSIRIVAGGNFFPDTPPINPITIFTLGTATSGVVMVGS